MEGMQTLEKLPKRAFLEPPARGSHDYTLYLDGFNTEKYIPGDIADGFKKDLGSEWEVMNRGSRLEFINKLNPEARHDDRIMNSVSSVLGPLGYDIDM